MVITLYMVHIGETADQHLPPLKIKKKNRYKCEENKEIDNCNNNKISGYH